MLIIMLINANYIYIYIYIGRTSDFTGDTCLNLVDVTPLSLRVTLDYLETVELLGQRDRR